MSRIGKKPIELPPGVDVKISDNRILIKGPKGEIEKEIPSGITAKIENNTIKVDLDDNRKKTLWGTIRTIIYNMVVGVTRYHNKKLIIEGQGYRAELKEGKLNLKLGYSHDIKFEPPPGIKIEVPSPQEIIVSGIDKEIVGNIAAKIRKFRPPEPYKGKGIRYEGEIIRRKTMKKGVYGGTA